jgi:hypothetical protein
MKVMSTRELVNWDSAANDLKPTEVFQESISDGRSASVRLLAEVNSRNTSKEVSEKAPEKKPESMDQRIKRTLGAEVYEHLSNSDKDWNWLIAHKEELAKGLMDAANEGNFHPFMVEVNRRCKHILFENNPRPASRPAGNNLDYIEPAAVDWLVKLKRGFLIPNDRLVNYVQWQDYTTSISR